jgi:hypothetical protein
MYNTAKNKGLNFLGKVIYNTAKNKGSTFLGKVIYNTAKNKGSTFLGILCGGRVNRPARPVKKPLPPFAPTTSILFACAPLTDFVSIAHKPAELTRITDHAIMCLRKRCCFWLLRNYANG